MALSSGTRSSSPSSRGGLRTALARLGQRELPDLVSTGRFARYREDPAGFVRDVLHIPTWPEDEYPGHNAAYLWPHQRDIMEAVAHVGRWAGHPVRDRTSVATCHAVGKDFTAGGLLLPWFLLSFEGSKVITTGPTDRQVRTVLWGEVHKSHRQAQAYQPMPGRLNLQEWRITPDYFAIGFATDKEDPEAAAGYHAEHILIIVDEASGIPEATFEALEGNISTGDARLLLIGNPLSTSGTFHDSHHAHRASWKTIQLGYADTPNFAHRQPDGGYIDGHGTPEVQASYFIQPDWVETRYQLWGPDNPLYEVRCLGHFPTAGINTLIALTWVQQAQHSMADPRRALEPVEAGVDVARFGDDESSIFVRRGRQCLHASSWSKRDLMASAHHIRRAVLDFDIRILRIDDIGLGGGVTDRLREMQEEGQLPPHLRIVPVNVAEAPRDPEHYKLLRDELWANFAERMRDGEVNELPDDPVLQSQLVTVTYKFNTKGQLEIEKKEEMKKRGLSSPDRADAAVLAFAPLGGTVSNRTQHEESEMLPKDTFFGDIWGRTF